MILIPCIFSISLLLMIGLVLCGGRSTRMGRDKGLLVYREETWAEAGLRKFAELSLPAFVSINPNQLTNYSSRIEKSRCVIDEPFLKIEGPLLGLMSAHLRFPESDVVLLACDLIKMEVEVLDHLIRTFRKSKARAMAFKGPEDQVEPMCAIFSSPGLKEIHTLYDHHQLSRFSMHWILDRLNAPLLQIPAGWKKYFLNYNTSEPIR